MEAFDDDDDFGEIYADVEPSLTSIPADLYIDKQQQQQTPDPNSNGNCNGDPNGDEKLVVAFSDGKAKKKDDDICCVRSDSDDDDDLNIVLNDDDCNGLLPVRLAASDDVDRGDGGGDDGGGDQLDDRYEPATKIEAKGGYGSRFFHRKYMRTRGLMFVNNMKASVNSIGMASSLNKGRRNVDLSSSHVTRMCAAANPTGFQCGYGSFLPWYWSIFDVNMEIFPEKPWRIPGVDITDYFNFGFTENTWKLYCASLEQLWQTSWETSIPDDESLKLNQEAMRERIDQVVAGSVLSPSSESEPPKGRAIQVEDSMIERQPSMDIRRPCSRDSDVIIQIKVHESSDDCSGSGNSIVMDASLEAEPIVGNDGFILNSSGECDDVSSEDQLEDVKNSVDSSAQERTGLIPGVDEDEHQDKVDQHSEGSAKVLRGEIKAEDAIAIDACSSDPCWIESELSLGDQELSLTSYTDSDYEATEDSLRVDNEKSHSPLKRKSVNSVTSLKESLPLDCNASESYGFNRKPVNVSYYARNRGPFRKEWRHQSGHEHGSNLNEHFENDTDASSIPMSSGRDLSLLGHQLIDYDICKEQRRQGYVNRKRRDISYNRETKQSYYASEKVNDNQFQTLQTKYSYREDREVLRENTNRYGRKHGKERDYFFEPRSPAAGNEEREGDWHHPTWGYYDDDLSPRSCWESRQFLPKHSSFPEEERGAYRRINDKYHFRDRYCNDDFDECESEFLRKSCRMSTSAEREMEFLYNKDEERFLYVDRDRERLARRDSHCDRAPLVLDDLWSGKREDNCEKHIHHQTPNFRHCRQSYRNSVRNYAYGTRGNDKFDVCGRPRRARDNRGSDWFYSYTDAAEDEDFMIDPAEEYQFYRSPSKVLNWTEDELICRHVETCTTSLHARVQIDDIKLQQHQLNRPRRSSENCLKGSSKIMGRGKRWQAVLRCRKSFDLVNGDGKSHTSSRVLCSGKLEYVDQGMAKKRRALVGSDESHGKAIKSGTSKCDSNHENKKLLQNLPDKGHKENSDIEEGQIVTEEPYTEASVSRRDVSEGAAVTESVKKRLSQNESNSDQLIGGYDSQRILDSLAKMEKRRERFKQPISTKKEAEESLTPNNDLLVDTGEMKQHRPPRKRRWVGS